MNRTLVVINNHLLLRDIKSLLPVGEYRIIANTDNGMEALLLYHRLQPDLLIMGWQMKGVDASNLLENLLLQHICPVLVVLTQEEHKMIRTIVKYGAHHLLLHPFSAIEIDTAIILAQRTFLTQRRHMEDMRKIEEELKTRKMVYQAILRIIYAKNIDEPQAYRQVRLQAMKTRKTLRATAESILKGEWMPE